MGGCVSVGVHSLACVGVDELMQLYMSVCPPGQLKISATQTVSPGHSVLQGPDNSPCLEDL